MLNNKIIELHSQGLSDESIAKELGLHRSTINKKRKNLGLKANNTKPPRKLTDEKLYELHASGLTDTEIGKLINMSPINVGKRRRALGLESNYKYGSEFVPYIALERYSYWAFTGHLLGDGYLNKPSDNSEARGNFAHSLDQEEYFDHKYEIFKDVCSEPIVKHHLDSRTNKTYSCKFTQHPTNRFLTELHSRYYRRQKNGSYKKVITPEVMRDYNEISLAYTFMDDGSKTPSGYNIALCSFSKKELNYYKYYINNLFNIDVTVRKTGTVYIKASDKQKFTELIKPYIHPSMYYKLHNHI